MKFVVIKEYSENVIEAEDFEEAFDNAWNNHSGYSDLIAIVRINEVEE